MKNEVNVWEIFSRLFSAFGPQGWWPVTLHGGNGALYRPGIYLPQSKEEFYEIAFGTILTQNTNWKNARQALSNLNSEGIKTAEDVLELDVSHLERLIRSSGYFRQKAKRLCCLAQYLVGKNFEDKATEIVREDLLSLPGVGPETADSILLYALGRPSFVIDSYTRRISVRTLLFKKEPGYYEAKNFYEESLVPNVFLYNEFHALIVKLAKQHCSPNPSCDGCPLNECCEKNIL